MFRRARRAPCESRRQSGGRGCGPTSASCICARSFSISALVSVRTKVASPFPLRTRAVGALLRCVACTPQKSLLTAIRARSIYQRAGTRRQGPHQEPSSFHLAICARRARGGVSWPAKSWSLLQTESHGPNSTRDERRTGRLRKPGYTSTSYSSTEGPAYPCQAREAKNRHGRHRSLSLAPGPPSDPRWGHARPPGASKPRAVCSVGELTCGLDISLQRNPHAQAGSVTLKLTLSRTADAPPACYPANARPSGLPGSRCAPLRDARPALLRNCEVRLGSKVDSGVPRAFLSPRATRPVGRASGKGASRTQSPKRKPRKRRPRPSRARQAVIQATRVEK